MVNLVLATLQDNMKMGKTMSPGLIEGVLLFSFSSRWPRWPRLQVCIFDDSQHHQVYLKSSHTKIREMRCQNNIYC
jgi:hypothetical protein